MARRRRRARPAGQEQGAGGHAARTGTGNRKREGGRAVGQDPSEIREEIEQTRARMGDTVEAIGYKTDVKSRAKDSVNEKIGGVRERITGVKQATPSGDAGTQGAQRAARH